MAQVDDPVVVAAIIAVLGFVVNGWVQRWADQRKVSYEKRMETYCDLGEALNRVGGELFALRTIRTLSWKFGTEEELNLSWTYLQRIVRAAELAERIVGGSTVERLRDPSDGLVKRYSAGESGVRAEIVQAIRVAVDHVDDLHINWASHYMDAAMGNTTAVTLLTTDDRVFRLSRAMLLFLKEEMEWTIRRQLLAEGPTVTDAEKSSHSQAFEDRMNGLFAALREDLARNRSPRRMGRNWPRLEGAFAGGAAAHVPEEPKT